MSRLSIVAVLAVVTGGLVGAYAHAMAQPPNRTGVTWTPLADVDLGAELGFEGHGLRSRLVTLPPGGIIPTHTHNDRPSVMYVVEGVATEQRGDQIIERRQGESFQIGRNTSHSIENKSGARAAYVETDVYRK